MTITQSQNAGTHAILRAFAETGLPAQKLDSAAREKIGKFDSIIESIVNLPDTTSSAEVAEEADYEPDSALEKKSEYKTGESYLIDFSKVYNAGFETGSSSTRFFGGDGYDFNIERVVKIKSSEDISNDFAKDYYKLLKKSEDMYNTIALKNQGGFTPKEISDTLPEISAINKDRAIAALDAATYHTAYFLAPNEPQPAKGPPISEDIPSGFTNPEGTDIVINVNMKPHLSLTDNTFVHEAAHVVQIGGGLIYGTDPSFVRGGPIASKIAPGEYNYTSALSKGYLFMQLSREQQAEVVRAFVNGTLS